MWSRMKAPEYSRPEWRVGFPTRVLSPSYNEMSANESLALVTAVAVVSQGYRIF